MASFSGTLPIPAPAGEPSPLVSGCTGSWVYPRACGEPCPSSGASSAFRVYPRACGSTRSGAGPGSAMRRFTPAARGLPLRADSKEMSLRFIPAARGPACVRHFSGISLEVWFSPGTEFRLAFPARVTLPCSPSTVRCTLGSSAGGLGLIRSGRCSRCSS